MRVAIVHEWLTAMGGSERVLHAIADLFPDAPIYTLCYSPDLHVRTLFADKEIRTSFIQGLPFPRKLYRHYLPLMPLAIERLDLRGFDIIISSSHAVAKGVLTSSDQLHISYVHSPMRYAWDLSSEYLQSAGRAKRFFASVLLHPLRQWDVISASRVDKFIANSQHIARRINKTYRRPSQVIYPPVDIHRFKHDCQRDDFFLVVSRLVPYKRVDLAIEAFNELRLPLVVIGDGPESRRLRHQAGAHITFLGWQEDNVIADHMQRCRALIFTAHEDFGIVPVEAQAAGSPVIAYGCGGALETVVDELTGMFFSSQTPASIIDAVKRFQLRQSWDAQSIRDHVERFSTTRFKQEFISFVQSV